MTSSGKKTLKNVKEKKLKNGCNNLTIDKCHKRKDKLKKKSRKKIESIPYKAMIRL